MTTIANIPIIDPNDNDPLTTYTAQESALKVSQVKRILNQDLGPNWKNVIVYAGLFIFFTMVLIIYGINSEDDRYKSIVGHFKALLLSIIIGVVLTIAWLSFKPQHDKTVYGVVPYPQNKPLVPPDSSLCGRSPRTCDPNRPDLDCDNVCLNNQGNSSHNYKCTMVDHPNVYYLGTRLKNGSYYCLPKEASESINACSKDFGKVVWTLNPDGTQGWNCQCLYPDLYGGDDCSSALTCQNGLVDNLASGLLPDTDQYGRYQYTINNGDPTQPSIYWSTWNSTNPPQATLGIPKPSSPYEMMPDPSDRTKKRPRFSCLCQPGTFNLPGDPFTCHKDICLNGGSFGQQNASPDGFFDQKTQTCKCSGRLVKTNVNGACYPPDGAVSLCKPHPYTHLCTYGWGIILTPGTKNGNKENIPVLIAVNVDSTGNIVDNNSGGSKKYLYAYEFSSSSSSSSYQVFIDVSGLVQSNQSLSGKFLDLTQTDQTTKNLFYWTNGVFSAFPILQNGVNGISISSDDIINAEKARNDANLNHFDVINTLASIAGGAAIKCDSFYFKRDGVRRCSDPLSKSGYDFQPLCDPSNPICGSPEICSVNLTKNSLNEGIGYVCNCYSGEKFNGTTCGGCAPAGTLLMYASDYYNLTQSDQDDVKKRCCSGNISIEDNMFKTLNHVTCT